MTDNDGIPIIHVLEEYEDIAMHFNEMPIKLRTQALGGAAAIATIVAAIGKSNQSTLIGE